jgi:DNA-binding transcriptional MerR regulator
VAAMHPDSLHPIGDVARRTGLTVSAVRFYSDEGIVRPAGLSPAGHRLYDLRAVAQLELVRTLRDLGTGLDEIRRLLAGEMTLPDLLAEHLALVERQERELRARRAVLRALTGQDDPAARARLMRGLVSMSDAQRERLVDDFWDEVGADVPADLVERLRTMRPRLPDDPTAAQLAAWVELADLLRDDGFRGAVRAYLRDTFAGPPGLQMAAGSVQDFIHGAGARTVEQIVAARHCGLPPDAPHARELAVRLVREASAATGVPDTAEVRERIAAGYLVVAEAHREDAADPQYETTHGRYLALVALVNGSPADTRVRIDHDVDLAELGVWIATALRASATTPV